MIKQLTKSLFVCGQMSLENLQQASQLGISSIICNRPNAEVKQGMLYAEVAKLADKQGMYTIYQPVPANGIEAGHVVEFEHLCGALDSPILAYCRTGTRCTKMWALSQLDKLEIAEITQTASNAGFDITEYLVKHKQSSNQQN